MKTSDFNYELPKELIAQTPLEKRDTSRLMTLDRKTGPGSTTISTSCRTSWSPVTA